MSETTSMISSTESSETASPSPNTAKQPLSQLWMLYTPSRGMAVFYTVTVFELIIHSYIFLTHQMIITLILLTVDIVVLLANKIPLLSFHALYLIYLTLRLARNPQPAAYSLSLQAASSMLSTKNGKRGELKECEICKRVKPPRYYHCRHCSRCVYRLDHHCNFVSNCVGFYNFKLYAHFLVQGGLHSIVVTSIIAWNYTGLLNFNSAKALYWFLLLPALFGIYENSRLLLAFKTTIDRNQTLIQSYKQVRGPNKSFRSLFEEYFGRDPLGWFLPTFGKVQDGDLLQPTFALRRDQEVKDYKYADEYLYGTDSEDEGEDKQSELKRE